MMDPFNRDELRKLVDSQGGPHLSIYLPTPARPNEAKDDGIRLGNLLRDSQQKLVDFWMPEAEAKAFLSPLQELCSNSRFLGDRRSGVALFRAGESFQTYRVDLPVGEKAVIGRSFHVRPILSQVFEASFYILALSQNRVALLSVSGNSITELKIPGLPRSFADESADVTVDRGAQVHSSGRGTAGSKQAAVFHGQGGHPETEKSELREYLGRVDDAVTSYLNEAALPIVLAGVDELTSTYRAITDSKHLCQGTISGNVDYDSDDVLLEKAAVVIAEQRDRQREATANQLREARHQLVATDPEQVLSAAFEGRVDTLFFDRDAELFGSFQPDTKTLKEIKQPPSGDPSDASHDLVEMAVVQSLLHRGEVYAVEQGKMPVDVKMAASLRY